MSLQTFPVGVNMIGQMNRARETGVNTRFQQQ